MTIEYYKNNKVSYKVSYKEVALIFQIGEEDDTKIDKTI